MTDRVKRLRRQSVETRPTISAERAQLLTDFYASGRADTVSVPVARALALAHLMEHRTICIQPGELLVGERGPAPKATPTYPELCCHSLEDFDVLVARDRTPFQVSDDVRRVYRDRIIPFWRGRTVRERLFAAMTDAWHGAFDTGVFTEFMEQRAFGHAILDDKIYHRGFEDFKRRIAERRDEIDVLADPRAFDKREELKAMAIAADALIRFAERHADRADATAASETDADRQDELRAVAEICRRVPARPPRTFHEALQMYWFVHLGVISELNTWDSFNPGRLDRHLWPFYERETAAGTLTPERARELLGCFWVKFNNQPAPPKVGITEEQSGTYQDFALINVGGVRPDGRDASNPLSSLLLDVVEEMQLIQPSVCVQVSSRTPDRLVRRAAEVIRTGLGQPSMFNTDVIVQEMLHDGKTLQDARAGGPSGCVTVSAFGKESCTLTGYINWPKILELACFAGVDPRTGRRVGPDTGDPRTFGSYEQCFEAYRRQLAFFLDTKIAGNNTIERLYATSMPAPYLSILMDDCIEKARDYHDGGARYNPTYIQGVGLGTLTDALAAVRHHVYERRTVSMETLLAAMKADFAGCEPLRRTLATQSPTYGNDDASADAIATEAFEAYYALLDGRPNTKGGRYRVNLLPTTVHMYFGAVTGALPNGRRAGVPVSEGISPTQGADVHGPTAVMQSAACIDHARTGGTLLNLKFSPQVLQGEGVQRLADLIRGYFRLGGHHVQFNVLDAETLRAAQKDPETYRNLIVRVAGYSDYFVDVGRGLQDEIISRTQQQGF